MKTFPQIEIKRCHSYEIRYKYTYVCTRCSQRIGRHSKSLKIDSVNCKLCGGCFKLL